MTYLSIKSLSAAQLDLLKSIEVLPKEFRDFCYDLLMDDRERYELGDSLIVYASPFTRWQAVSNFVDRFNGISIKEIAEKNKCSNATVAKRLDKLRDAFTVFLVGGYQAKHRGQAYMTLRKAGWHEEDLCAVLRNSSTRLQAYAAWTPKV